MIWVIKRLKKIMKFSLLIENKERELTLINYKKENYKRKEEKQTFQIDRKIGKKTSLQKKKKEKKEIKMDLLYGLRGVGAEDTEDAIIEDEIENTIEDDLLSVPDGLDSGRMPTPEELLSILDEMNGLSDEDKESLRDELTKTVKGENNFGQTAATTTPFSSQALILFALLAIIALIFGKI